MAKSKEEAPIVRGVSAERCRTPKCCMCRGSFKEVFAKWKCPHCKAHLSKDSRICLNGCGLTASSLERFNTMMKNTVNDKGIVH